MVLLLVCCIKVMLHFILSEKLIHLYLLIIDTTETSFGDNKHSDELTACSFVYNR